jgi:putative spermidine/putrescine transport system permease protein
VNSLLSALGLIDDPLGLMLTEGAITVGLVHVYIPYMILAIYTSLQNVDPRVVLAARSLGGSAFRAFLGVTLPLSVPGIASGSLLVFTLSASSFSTPAILGGQRAQVMSYVVYKEIYALQDWEFGSTVSMILLLSIGVVALLYLRLIENRRYRAVFG